MPHVYSSKDAGLPAFYTTSTASLQRFNNYKLIFKSCLVDGYGSRPAAGWAAANAVRFNTDSALGAAVGDPHGDQRPGHGGR